MSDKDDKTHVQYQGSETPQEFHEALKLMQALYEQGATELSWTSYDNRKFKITIEEQTT